MTTPKTFLLASLTLGAALPALAQQLPDPTSILRQAHGITEDQGTLWGLGADYKAAFTRGGIEYTPALGDKAPHNMPLRLTLQSIRRGGTVLYETGPGSPPAARDGDCIVYRRTADLREEFEVRADGVELRYVFGNRPPGSGDLVVRARIDTELAFEPAAEGSAPRFLLAGVGGVSIGAVTGVDARGDQAPGALRCDGATLEMVLPAAFVDRAAYPLVLDPLIGTEFPVALGAPVNSGHKEPAVAFDLATGSYLVVWQRAMSGVDRDIAAHHVRNGSLWGGLILVTTTTNAIEDRPAIANVRSRGRFLVVWQVAASPFGPWNLECRAVDAGVGTMSAVVPLYSDPSVDQTDPQLCGDSGGGDRVLMVWHREGQGIRGAPIAVPATGAPTLPLAAPVVLSSDANATDPAISLSRSSFMSPAVVVYRGTGRASLRAILAQAVDQNLRVLHQLPVMESLAIVRRPAVDGNGVDFLVAWDQLVGNLDVWCRSIRWDARGRLTPTSSPAPITADGHDQFGPRVAWLNGKYAVLWTSHDPATPVYDFDIEGTELGPNCQICGQRFRLAGANRTTSHDVERTPDIGTRYAGGDPSRDEGLIVFSEASTLPPFSTDIVAQTVEAFRGGSLTNLGGGCGNGGTAGISARPAIGDGTFELRLSGAAPSATFMAVGIHFVNSANTCGPCSVMSTPNWFLTFPTGPGAASYPLGIPCDPSFVGLPVHSQWAVFFSGASPCPLAPPGAQLSFSNRLRSVVDF